MVPTRLLVCAAVLLAAACTSRQIEKELRIVDVHTGWYDAGLVDGGMNKLVPSITLRLENASAQEIERVQLMAIFRRVGEEQAWGESFVSAIGPDGLDAGATGENIRLRSSLGYTGAESRLQMLENSEFVDARAEVFGKHGSRTWVKLGDYPIDRQLLTD